MYTETIGSNNLNDGLIKKLTSNWQHRVAVNQFKINFNDIYIENVPDFPESLIPFRDHPWYLNLSSQNRFGMLAAVWIAYNEKTIQVEDYIINPFCRNALRGAYEGTSGHSIKQVIAQTIIDEQFHILMCIEACNVARTRFQLERLKFEKPFVVHRMETKIRAASDAREEDVLYLAFATVAEMTINAYLSQLSTDATIQPLNRLSVDLHRRDELAHSVIFNELVRSIYSFFSEWQKQQFIQGLREAYNAFTTQDLSIWSPILLYFKCTCVDDIITHIKNKRSVKNNQRDHSSLIKLLKELTISEEMILNTGEACTHGQ